MRSTIQLDDDFIAAVRRTFTLDEKFVSLSIDPGTSSGCSVDDGRTAITTQGTAVEVADHLALAGAPRALLFVREAPYTASREQMARDDAKATPKTIYGMGFNAGVIVTRLERFLLPGAVTWSPMPSTWRSVLGLNRKKNAYEDERTATNNAVHQWAEATSRSRMRTARGEPAFDEANAYAMGRAARAVVRSILVNR